MKIVCDACQAKYSISDDKVQGKVFKIRCKKCSNIIVVRGGAGAAEAAPASQEKDTRVYDYGYEGGGGGDAAAGGDSDAVWHLVINQDQVGPMTVAEVESKFAAGEIDGETFTWREGFADWLPLSQVDAFAALVSSGSTTTASSGGGGSDAVANMFGTSSSADEVGTARSDPGDLFAAAGASGSRKRDEDDGGDLFGSKPASRSTSSQSAAEAQAAAEKKLRGERNENSVLFSLNNLAQLASDTPRPGASSSSSSSGSSSSSSSGHATGAAGGEGSGLIDIRSMANAYMGGASAGAAKPATASSGIGSIDDLPVFGGGGFSEPAVIMPVASRSSGNNKMLYMMIAAVGLLALVAIIMVVFLLKGDKKPAQVASNTPGESDKGDKGDKASADKDGDKGSADADKPTATEKEGTKEPEAAKEPEKTPEAAKEPEGAKTAAPKAGTPAAHTIAKAEPKAGAAAPKAEPKAAPAAAAPKADAGGGGCDEVSCVLSSYEGACCAKFKKGGAPKAAPKASGGGDLPDGLDRGMISAGIANVKARVSACGDKSPAKGKVKVKVAVSGDGKVTSVSVETTPDAALGACVQSAVQKASFAKTQSGGSFSYPFVF